MSSDNKQALLRYGGLAFQMLGFILVFTFLGRWADTYFSTPKPYFTLTFSLAGVLGAMYFFLKNLLKKQ